MNGRRSRGLGCAVLLWMAGSVVMVDAGHAQTSSLGDSVRFLEQSTFGPTTELANYVIEFGVQAFLDEQFAAPSLPYPELPLMPANQNTGCPVGMPDRAICLRDNYSMYPLQVHFFSNALYGADQVRQRVAFALSQILVTSGRDVTLSSWMRPYQQILYSGAFGNYRDLLYNVTLNAAMGRYLDMVNNRKFNPLTGVKPNENYAREVLQLFSIGVFELNQDGTSQLDADGNPIPTYDQDTIEEFSKVFTGWIFAPQPSPGIVNYIDPMIVQVNGAGRALQYEQGEKRLLNGVVLPACETPPTLCFGADAERDLGLAIDNIFNHPNVGPFIGKQLIQKLVTSNPSPAYVARVAAVFNDNGAGGRGDLQAVTAAILLDPEARGDARPEPGYGHLREPVLFMTGLLRAFNVASDGVLNSLTVGGSQIGAAQMDQDVFRAPTVFNFYPPDYEVPGEPGVLGPEFAIHSSMNALRRANFVTRIVFNSIPPAPPNRPSGTAIDLTPLEPLANDPPALVEQLNLLLLHGEMSESMRNVVTEAVGRIPESRPDRRVQVAVYLIATSSQYQVER